VHALLMTCVSAHVLSLEETLVVSVEAGVSDLSRNIKECSMLRFLIFLPRIFAINWTQCGDHILLA